MTKKHLIALADHIKNYNKFAAHPFNEVQVQALAVFCQFQNPNFNRQRWLDYIAGGGSVKPYGTKIIGNYDTTK